MPLRKPTAPPHRPRAISADHKRERRQDILAASLLLLEQHGYESITMAALAEQLGLAKGTLYLYFATKESLFLAVQTEQLATWFADLRARLLLRRRRPLTAQALAQLLVASLGDYPQLPRLLSLLHSVLERNIALSEAIEFKRFLRQQVGETGAALELALPSLRRGQGGLLILRLHTLVIGSWLATDPSAVVRTALADPDADLAIFDLHFAPFLTGSLTALLRGMLLRR
jgi:AcrR family transcriptional regulator